ncbi:CRISPR-associated autoregulator, DevR family [Pyrolobus fumarii 1A]|uniref:CRISPR-associated autoregulator, DevR family n=1 Tax=Pyrolobus fumarii (strain DSM 11204 / 1A) TaxID=694429 RepID=G0EG53_PYRF1|nr:type I-A CRISPR-associated protein Cas7/Csa2 [Pyrolobus fumarii]AEM38301.1 CRISPR-associated autoregulator, DevR family [Pyrolobus fumarii 1A]
MACSAYLTLTARLLVNVEALNMAETVGNLARHKRIPMVVPVEGEEGAALELRMMPAISGQSLAHGYQRVLARRALAKGLPVCKLCEQGVFVKHASDEVLERLRGLGDAGATTLLQLVSDMKKVRRPSSEQAARFVSSFEEGVVRSCVVEDVGGFLYAGRLPVRRTSRVSFSYMIPSLQYVNAVGVEGVLHARHDPVAVGEQMIYVVEVGAALYTFSVLVDLCGIGVVERQDGGETVLEDRVERVRVAVEALGELVSGAAFGAKRSRILPHWEVESIAAAVVEGFRFQMPGGHHAGYIREAAERLSRASRLLGGSWRMAFYIREYPVGRLTEEPSVEGVAQAKSPEEVFEKLVEWSVEAVTRG